VAARIKEQLGIEVELRDGPFGRAAVIVDGETVASTGLSGWLPRTRIVIDRVRAKLTRQDLGGTAEPQPKAKA
jgi:hypothetical protein